MKENQKLIIQDILDERGRQDKKWGEQNHIPLVWLAILGEEAGEVSKAIIENLFGNVELCEYREELIHVAAVAMGAIESYDRNHK